MITDETYLAALKRIEELWDAEPGSAEERDLDELAELVNMYERERFNDELG